MFACLHRLNPGSVTSEVGYIDTNTYVQHSHVKKTGLGGTAVELRDSQPPPTLGVTQGVTALPDWGDGSRPSLSLPTVPTGRLSTSSTNPPVSRLKQFPLRLQSSFYASPLQL